MKADLGVSLCTGDHTRGSLLTRPKNRAAAGGLDASGGYLPAARSGEEHILKLIALIVMLAQ